jgi:lipopolysaccharide export system permease protein
MILVILILGSFLVGILADILAAGVPASVVAKFLFFKMPSAAAVGIPLALLFASLLGLTRLGQDGEIKAALLLGLSPINIATPMFFLGLTVSLLSFVNNETVVPWGEQRALEVQKEILLRRTQIPLTEGNFFADSIGRHIFVKEISPGGLLSKITVIRPGGLQGANEVTQAEGGILNHASGNWHLSRIIFRLFRQNHLVLRVEAEEGYLPVRDLKAAGSETRDLIYLPLRKLLKRLTTSPGSNNPTEWTALHRKFSEPLAATIFALFALVVAISSLRWGVPLGMTAVLILTFVYYATWSVSRLLGEQGLVPPWFAGWAPFLLYALFGIGLFLANWRR